VKEVKLLLFFMFHFIFFLLNCVNKQPPVAEFTYTPEMGTKETVFIFDASESHDWEDEKDKLIFRWTFGDQAPTYWSGNNTIQYQFNENGDIVCTLEVKDTDNMIGREEKILHVYEGHFPQAGFTVSPKTGSVFTTFQFDASSSSDIETPNDQLEVRWQFAQDPFIEWTTDKTTSHQFSETGTWIITLEVRDESGLISSYTDSCYVIYTDPADSIKIMSYNILFGGIYPGYGWKPPYSFYPGDRLSLILDVFKIYNPDILGVQEATDWDKGDPPLVDSIAQVLNMDYVMADKGTDQVVIFSKFEILQSQSYHEHLHAGLKVLIKGPYDIPMRFFVAHLHPDPLKREEELQFLANTYKPRSDTLSVLMGDMNTNVETFMSYNPGWDRANLNKTIDQIWVSGIPDYCKIVKNNIFQIINSDLLDNASDHYPVISQIDFYE